MNTNKVTYLNRNFKDLQELRERHALQLNELYGFWRADVLNTQRWAIVGFVVFFIVGTWAGMVIEGLRG